ncbi:MAG TPA: YolD-like family protein [Bacillales bacterium]|nr:YolD-like family protein [Bacillales bacterium]
MSEHLKRGNMLWEGSRMFLPEHKQALLKRKQQQEWVEKPIIDEQTLVKLDETICEAMAENRLMRFEYYRQGQIHTLTGKAIYYDETNHQLRIHDKNGEPQQLDVKDIVEVGVLE